MIRRFVKVAAHACDQAYYAKPRIETFLAPGSGYTQFNVGHNGMSVTIYDTHPVDEEVARRTYIVAFRGTDQGVDWMTNLSLVKQVAEMPDGVEESTRDAVYGKLPWYCFYTTPRLHKGFVEAYGSLKGVIRSYFEQQHTRGELKGSRLILTGHSLGGALSTVCAYDLYHYGKMYSMDIQVLTLGGPRVCNLYASVLMAEMYKDRGLRIVNGMDPVSLCPLTNSWHCFPLANLYQESYWKCFTGMLWLPRTSIHLATNYIKNIQSGMLK